jgi:hypothetical protein
MLRKRRRKRQRADESKTENSGSLESGKTHGRASASHRYAL